MSNTRNEIIGLLEKLPHKLQVEFALYCAKDVFHLVRDKDKPSISNLLNTTEKWLKDEAAAKEVATAANAAGAAYYAANAAAIATAAAAIATAAAADATTTAAANAAGAAYATYAYATYASYASYAAAADAASAAAADAASADAAYNATGVAKAAKLEEYLACLIKMIESLPLVERAVYGLKY